MNRTSYIPAPAAKAITPVERLVEIADAIFERATKLDGIKLDKHSEEATATIEETRDEAFDGVIEVWSVAIDILPTSGLEHAQKRELEIDGYKVMSRCYHRIGNLDEAKRAITLAIDLGYLDGFISLGAICMDLKDFKSAENAFESALAKNVQSMRAHAGLGELYFKLGTAAIKKDPTDTEYLFKAEEAFVSAGKERFTESFERAMDLFETIGWRDKAMSFGLNAAQFYETHRLAYGDKIRNINTRLRKLAGEERHDKFIEGVGRKLGDLVGGKKRDPNR